MARRRRRRSSHRGPKTEREDALDVAHEVLALIDVFGEGYANRLTFAKWESRFGRGRSRSAVKQHWDRLKKGIAKYGIPLDRSREGKNRPVVLGPDARAYVEEMLDRYARKEAGVRP